MLAVVETAISACYRTLRAHLSAEDALWGGRAYPLEVLPAQTVKPYVVFFVASAIEPQDLAVQRAELVVSVKCVAETLGDSLAGASRIRAYLDDSGTQDISPRLPTLATWEVTAVTLDRAIHLQEAVTPDGVIYHDGHQYLITMEVK